MPRVKTPPTRRRGPQAPLLRSAPEGKRARSIQCDTLRPQAVGEQQRVVLVHMPKGTAIVGAGYTRVLVREWWETHVLWFDSWRCVGGPFEPPQFPNPKKEARDYAQLYLDDGDKAKAVHVRRYRILREGR